MVYEEKKILGKIFSGRKLKTITIAIVLLKVLVFASLLTTGLIMYSLGKVGYGNDLLIISVIFVLLNKQDK